MLDATGVRIFYRVAVLPKLPSLERFVYAGFGRKAAVLKSLLHMFCPMLACVTRGLVTPGVSFGIGDAERARWGTASS
jgi:hypothetical protein